MSDATAPAGPRWTEAWRSRRRLLETRARALSRIELATLLAILAVAAFVRLRNLSYNTAFVDETINVLIARWLRAGEPGIVDGHLLSWHVGWYLFPWIAALGDRLGGIEGIRVLCGVMGVGVVAAVFAYTRILFGNVAGMGAAAIFAVLAPPVFAGRVAFREAGTIFFLAVALWLYARAMTTHRRREWFGAALAFFAAFLCKHPIAILAPPLAIGAAAVNPRALRWFSVSLFVLCAAYVARYWTPWWEMMAFLSTTDIAQAPRRELIALYVTGRLDVWLLAALALGGALSLRGAMRWIAWSMIGVAALFAAVNVAQHTDYLTYKQATYPLLFLVPLASWAIARLASTATAGPAMSAAAFVVVASTAALAGRGWRWTSDDVGARWPNNELVQTYLKGWSGRSTRLLTDDQTLVYYLWDWYDPHNITTAFFFEYQGLSGQAAYAQAIRDGYFDVVSFGGARARAYDDLHAAIDSLLPLHYELAVSAPDPVLGAEMRTYRRTHPAIDRGASGGGDGVEILAPAPGAIVDREGPITVSGRAALTHSPGYAQLDVYTDRWYPQGDPVDVDPMTGDFRGDVWLGGGGAQRCHHLIRARVYDLRGRLLGMAAVADVGRNDGPTVPSC